MANQNAARKIHHSAPNVARLQRLVEEAQSRPHWAGTQGGRVAQAVISRAYDLLAMELGLIPVDTRLADSSHASQPAPQEFARSSQPTVNPSQAPVKPIHRDSQSTRQAPDLMGAFLSAL